MKRRNERHKIIKTSGNDEKLHYKEREVVVGTVSEKQERKKGVGTHLREEI